MTNNAQSEDDSLSDVDSFDRQNKGGQEAVIIIIINKLALIYSLLNRLSPAYLKKAKITTHPPKRTIRPLKIP